MFRNSVLLILLFGPHWWPTSVVAEAPLTFDDAPGAEGRYLLGADRKNQLIRLLAFSWVSEVSIFDTIPLKKRAFWELAFYRLSFDHRNPHSTSGTSEAPEKAR